MKMLVENGWDGLGGAISAVWDFGAPKKAIIITDENIARLYLDDVKKAFDGSVWEVFCHIIPPGEENKNFAVLAEVLQKMHDAGLDRASVVFALGGGVVSDIAGFAASCYMRGIDYANLPTTLLGQVDSALGGKTGIDFLGQKNLVGAFHAPRLVFSNIKTLKSLREEDFISGLAEAIKYGIIYDRELLNFLQDNREGLLGRENAAIMHIVRRCQAIKMEIVEQDEKDKDLRQILNFGHTIGHAVESLADFALPHGHCVAIGMVAELEFSVKNHGLPQKDMDFAVGIIKSFGLPTTHNFTQEQIFEQAKHDKKTINGQVKIVAVRGIL